MALRRKHSVTDRSIYPPELLHRTVTLKGKRGRVYVAKGPQDITADELRAKLS